MNLPNLLTVLRIGLVPVYAIVFFSDSPYNMQGALLILILAGLTDILDGTLARKYKWVTDLGSMLDPLADKLMMLTVMLCFVLAGRVSWLAAGLLIVRDTGMILVSVIFVSRGKKTVPATYWGKANTLLYYLALAALMFEWPNAAELLWGVILLAFVTSLTYIRGLLELNAKQ